MSEDINRRLDEIIAFCREIDKEKFVQRRTFLTDGERLENDAEHAWHMAVMALLLTEYSNVEVDRLRVVSMLLVHDLVEVYAGDTFAYDEDGKKTQRQRELAAADKLFAQLPEDLCKMMRGLWDEFEEWESPEAKFAHFLDNFQPLMLQHASGGRAWREAGRKVSEVIRRNEKSRLGSEILWRYAYDNFIKPEIEAGNLKDDTE